MSLFVLDSFAILAWYRSEESGARVQQLLDSTSDRRWMTVVNLGEVYYRVAKERNAVVAVDALSVTERLPITFVNADRRLTIAAANIKARFPLAYADCFAAALAQQLDARVVTGDPEFARIERAGIVSIEWLPRARR